MMGVGDLVVSELSAGYRGCPVLRSLTLAPIRRGYVTALVGPNAAGKTTLLRVLAGLLPGQGVVQHGGRDLLSMSTTERAKVVSYMPQALPDRVSLAVIENVIGALKASDTIITGENAPAVDRAIAVLDRLGIADIALSPLDHLSGGQRQLAGLAQSLVRDPEILLLDEPTSALDLRHQVTVMQTVRVLAEEEKSIICVLHDLSQAARWADEVIVLSHGRLYRQGTPEETITPAMLADVYGVVARVDGAMGFQQITVDDVQPRPHSSEGA